MKLNVTEESTVTVTKNLFMERVSALPTHPMGHAFMWATLTITRVQKNGVVKTFPVKVLLGGICVADLDAALAIARSLPNVHGCYYNMD